MILTLALLTSLRVDVEATCAAFTGFDQDGDGAVELARVTPLDRAGEAGPVVLVLVEARVLEPLDGAESLDERVERLVVDLAAEGYRAHALAIELGASAQHQDGRYVLALREMLRAVAAEDELAGALLVGHFPDAFLVRTCNWRKRGDLTLRRGREDERTWKNARYVRRVPEDVAHRADIVLADLDGRWENLYVQPRTRLETVLAVYEGVVPTAGGACADLERGAVVFEDFFHVSDGKLEVAETLDDAGGVAGWSLLLDDRSADHECAAVDAERAENVLARPDILVSRLDARGSALRPRADVLGVDGEGLLDAAGAPRAVKFATAEDVPHWSAVWELDPLLERRLLAEYLDRNHAWRTGAATGVHRHASIAHDLGSGYAVMSRAAEEWTAETDPARADVSGRPTLAEFAAWIAYPAVLRTLRAHSDPWGSVFARGDVAALEASTGGASWSWSRRGDALVPSLASACGGGKLDWFLLRTLWEDGAVAPEPAFYHHTGCHGISPPGAKNLAFDHPAYGVRQGAEALLFFGNGLALVGRAKVFYDEPRGFADALRERATFGAAWARYFDHESRAQSWAEVGGDIGRKRAYFWSVLGDWSLKLTPTTAPR